MKLHIISEVLYPESRAVIHHTLQADVGLLSVSGYERLDVLCSKLAELLENNLKELRRQICDLQGGAR